MTQFARPRLLAQLVALNVGIVVRGVRHPRTKLVLRCRSPEESCSDSTNEYLYGSQSTVPVDIANDAIDVY